MWASARVPPADVPNLRARLAQIFGMAAAWGFVAEVRLHLPAVPEITCNILYCSRLLLISSFTPRQVVEYRSVLVTKVSRMLFPMKGHALKLSRDHAPRAMLASFRIDTSGLRCAALPRVVTPGLLRKHCRSVRRGVSPGGGTACKLVAALAEGPGCSSAADMAEACFGKCLAELLA